MGQVNHTRQFISAGLVSIGFFALTGMSLPAAAETVRMEGAFNDDVLAADASPIVVSGRAGRFDRVSAVTLQIPLKLDATLGEGGSGRKIVGSDLFLKQSGAASGAPATDARDRVVPHAQLALQKTFDFNIDPLGPVVQNAIALCNGNGAAATVSMSLPIVWRVTTGRFNFKWVNYDRVGPSDDIVSNPEFYADRETHEIDIAATVPVRCDGNAAPVASASAGKPTLERTAAVQAALPAKKTVDVSVQPVSNATPVSLKATEIDDIPAKAVTVEAAQSRTVCDGGMLRQNGMAATGVCLCPGNTRRVETGTNAFACERKVGRR